MPSDYNPNSIWTSKQKKYEYNAPAQPTEPKPQSEPVHSPNPNPRPETANSRRWIVWAVVGFCVILAGAVAAYFFLRPAPAPDVSITFANPGQVLVGDPFILAISYTNNSKVPLRGATLSLTLPDGVAFAGEPPSQRVMQWQVGDVGADVGGSESSTLIVMGTPDSVEHVSAQLTYTTDSSPSTMLASNGQTGIAVGDSALGLTITGPASVFSGQDFSVKVAYVNNSNHSLPEMNLALQYPPAFVFGTSSVAADSSADDAWEVGPLAAGASGSFNITGTLTGPANAPYVIMATAETDLLGQMYSLANQDVTLAIAPSPLTLIGTLNNQPNYVASLADSLVYTFTYTNNSNATLLNAVIAAQFVGTMFDFTSLRSTGSFSSLNDTVTWNGANTPALASIAPGQSGIVTVNVRTKPSFPIHLASNKDYTLDVRATIQSPTVPAGTAASGTVSSAAMQNKVGGVADFTAAAYFKDAASGIVNQGPYPPTVNEPTQYTVHWQIVNYSTDIANVSVSAYLQSGTTCTGAVKNNVASSTFVCYPATGEVTWTIPAVPATTGVIGPPAAVIFQVTNTPAVNEVGQDVTLLGQTTFQATDEFTSSTLQSTVQPLKTDLPDDKAASNGNRQVVQ